MIQDNMLRPVRLNAGLGNPPEAYYNNTPESANKVIKMGVDFRKSKSWAEVPAKNEDVQGQNDDNDATEDANFLQHSAVCECRGVGCSWCSTSFSEGDVSAGSHSSR